MKKIMVLSALGMLMIASGGMAQTIYDGAKLTGKDLNGTARFVGMGGAMGALGGDISTIGTNPAGIGLYRSSDVMTSFGFSLYGNESQYLGKKFNSDLTKGDFNNIGFVFSSKIGNETPLRFVNFGFNYHRAKSFNNNMRMEGNLGLYSQTYLMAFQAAGITQWGDFPYMDNSIGWLSILGADAGLIRDITITEGENNIPYTYKDEQGNDVQYKDINGNPLYISPGRFEGMLDNGYANFRSEERGGIDQYDFNVSFNFNDRAYLGVTLGAYSVDYNKYTFYDENYGNGEGYNLQSWNRIKGSGFDVKLGAIIRPFEYSPFRVGLAIHTPIFYRLEYKTSAQVISDVMNLVTGEIKGYDVKSWDNLSGKGDMVRSFNFQTPWTYNVSVGYTVGKSLALGAEYEYKDYSSMKFKDTEGYSSAYEFENSTTSMLKGVSTVRLGLEYKVIPQFAFRAGYNYSTAAFREDAFKDLTTNSIQTDTDFSNSKSMSNYTLGIGYRGSMFYADLAYKFSTYKEDFYPFVNGVGGTDIGSPEATKVTNTRSQVLFTVGMRF
ncbi:TonB-dependent receptor [Bacteroides sp. AN502(2024)]|uniref:TonB-dependent receptor n=1 Tax=Bacteroides sp. AN502(2024) TaxID=3160599 RepID=UPI0035160BA2